MHIDDKIVEAIRNNQEDLKNNDLVSIILEVYLRCGTKGIGELKKLFIDAEIDMKLYNDAIDKIIKGLLKNSDLWNPDSKYSIWYR